ncbi:MerR family transcriptional regulator [Chitinophaga sp. GCM10012297]|uniref:MerR family transcriptional regulator n=1 Tax=Chitinophaga chungangae TaxID=2821488 RepID=A0ABS3YK00_9BACT|nr:MerR family transcriptional regulator [Chitinophaga chungangae]MBO9155009.1 MerR family transcriptional regulator [Chitinophaga chungangae]
MANYAVKKLAGMAGVSVRTLHHYDRIGLLRPSVRTEAGYRLYGEKELLRLQQILFYKEMDFELKTIAELLDDPEFDMVQALQHHKKSLLQKKKRIETLLGTLEKTIDHLKNKQTMKHEDLYKGLSKEQAQAWRKEAMERWPGQVKHSEQQLLKMSPEAFEELKTGFGANWQQLMAMTDNDPHSAEVQQLIADHYRYILQFWGKPEVAPEAYKGLADLYVSDERYTAVEGKPNRGFAAFMQKAMYYFADHME